MSASKEARVFVMKASPEALQRAQEQDAAFNALIEEKSRLLPEPRRSMRRGDDRAFARVMRPASAYRGDRSSKGVVPSEFEVCVIPGESITIREDGEEMQQTFLVGDQAEYDSWNLRHYNAIAAITPKTVRVKRGHEERCARLDHYTFCRRNFGFDQRVALKNNMHCHRDL